MYFRHRNLLGDPEVSVARVRSSFLPSGVWLEPCAFRTNKPIGGYDLELYVSWQLGVAGIYRIHLMSTVRLIIWILSHSQVCQMPTMPLISSFVRVIDITI